MYVTQFARYHFALALAALATAQHAAPSEDDRGMVTAPADDLLLWADDLESRVGLSVADFRAELLDFIIARDGGDDADMRARGVDLRTAFHLSHVYPAVQAEGHGDCLAGMPSIADLMDEEAWHKDACAKFSRLDAEYNGLQLFVDYPNDADRECPGPGRFILCRIVNGGHDAELEQTEDANELRAMIRRHIAEGA